MASFVLGAVGSAFFGPIGGIIGAAVGGLIDNAIFAPDAPDIVGPRLLDLKVSSSTYGTPIPRAWGSVRLPTNLIFSTPLNETATTTEIEGGKGGGGGGSSTQYTYDVTCATAVCRGPIIRFERVWGDSKLIRDIDQSNPIFSVTATDIAADGATNKFTSTTTDFTGLVPGEQITTSGFINSANNGTFTVTSVASALQWTVTSGRVNPADMSITSDDGDDDFSTLVAGDKITVFGFTSEVNNGVFTVAGASTTTIFLTNATLNTELGSCTIVRGANSVTVSGGTLTNESAGATVTINEVDTGVEAFAVKNVSSLTMYVGNETQNPDPIIESFKGTGQVPGHRGLAYLVFNVFQLADYGNRIPNITVEVVADESVTIGDIVGDILLDAGYSALEFDVSELDMPVIGYAITREITTRDAIQTLMALFQFDAYEFNGVLYFRKRKIEVLGATTLVEDDLAAHDYEEERPDPLTISRGQELELPLELTLTFLDQDRDYQANTVISRRITPKANGVSSVSAEIVLTPDQAQQSVETMHYRLYSERTKYKFNTDWSKISIKPGDNILVQYHSRDHFMRITKATIRRPGLIEFEGSSEEISTYTSTSTGTSGGFTPGTLESVGNTISYLLDIPILRDIDNDGGFYAAAHGTTGYRGSNLFQSSDGGTNYDIIAAFGPEAVAGISLTTLGNFTANPGWDFGSTVDVFLHKGQLESLTELAVLNGGNGAILGNEVIQFRTATLIGPNQYRLSNLLRGRRGTEWATGTHAAAERFVLLDSLWTKRIVQSISVIGQERLYKAVTIGQDITAVDPIAFTNTGVGLKPFSPVHLAGTRHIPTTNDWTLTWVRRTRIGGEWQDGADVPLGEETEEYDVEIMQGSTVKRTTRVTSQSFVYTAAMQTTDFGSAQSTITFRVYQISSVIGRGYVTEKTV